MCRAPQAVARYGGRIPTSGGATEDLIMDVQLLRPDRTLLAKMVIGSPEAKKLHTDIYDATGSKVIERVTWQKTKDHPQGSIKRAEREPATPPERTWLVNRYGVVYQNGDQEFPEYKDAPYRSTVTPAKSLIFGPVMERVLPSGVPCREQYFQFRSGEVFIVGNGPSTSKEEAAYD